MTTYERDWYQSFKAQREMLRDLPDEPVERRLCAHCGLETDAEDLHTTARGELVCWRCFFVTFQLEPFVEAAP